MEKQARDVVEALIDNQIIQSSMKEYYAYAMEIILERCISVATMIVIGVCMGKLMSSIVFALFFITLKRYTGGYHTRNFSSCYVESMIIFWLVLLLGDRLVFHTSIMMFLLFVSFLLIMLVGTINHPNMNYNMSELMEAQKAARYVVLLEMFIIISLHQLKANRQYLCYMSLGVILCAASIALAKLTKQEVTA